MPYSYSNAERAQILVEALPYIKKHSGKIVVIKYGGNAMINETLKQQVMEDIVLLWHVGVKIVGKKAEFVDGLRVTDKETIDIVQMVLAGKVNNTLVNLLQMQGGNALGLSGADGHLIKCKIKDPRLGFVGEVTEVNEKPVLDLLEKGYIPVVSTVGCDDQGNAYNINGDTAAACIAGALKAETFILMTDVPGILRDKDDDKTLIPAVTVAETKQLKEEGIIAGGMLPKVKCCEDAIEKGVNNVIIMDGRVPHSILMELLTDEGAGTMVTGE